MTWMDLAIKARGYGIPAVGGGIATLAFNWVRDRRHHKDDVELVRLHGAQDIEKIELADVNSLRTQLVEIVNDRCEKLEEQNAQQAGQITRQAGQIKRLEAKARECDSDRARTKADLARVIVRVNKCEKDREKMRRILAVSTSDGTKMGKRMDRVENKDRTAAMEKKA